MLNSRFLVGLILCAGWILCAGCEPTHEAQCADLKATLEIHELCVMDVKCYRDLSTYRVMAYLKDQIHDECK